MSTVSSPAEKATATVSGALIAIALTAPLLAVSSWGDSSESNPARRFVITLAVAIVCAVPVFGWAVPRARRLHDGNTAIVLAVLALLSLAVFWMGVTLVFAVGAVSAGLGASTPGGATGGRQRAAVILGALAAVAFIAVTLLQLG